MDDFPDHAGSQIRIKEDVDIADILDAGVATQRWILFDVTGHLGATLEQSLQPWTGCC